MPEQATFLDRIRQKRRGSLKLYIGMAAGVGKTYRMLSEAQALQRRGADVVVGLVVTHGRAETEALVAGLDVFPTHKSFYKGKEVEEMDLPGLLRRRPEIVLVDELAHTNTPGSKNGKRWQDVYDLLEAGINVISAMNIQHLEGLADAVKRITGIEMQERVPDHVLHRADEVVNIDVPADELIQRLREGKIYRPDRVEAALNNFFQHDNLLQLRELALREVANRLETRIESSLPTGAQVSGEKIALFISTNEATARHMIRRTARIASFLNADWWVVYVQTPREAPDKINLAAQRHLIHNFNLAKEMGAEIVTLKGTDVARTMAEFCTASAITLAVVGKSNRSRLYALLYGDLVRKLVRLTHRTSTDILIIGV